MPQATACWWARLSRRRAAWRAAWPCWTRLPRPFGLGGRFPCILWAGPPAWRLGRGCGCPQASGCARPPWPTQSSPACLWRAQWAPAPHGPQPPGDGQAILAGQADVEHHYCWAMVEQERVQGGAIRHAPGVDAEVRQARQQDVAELPVVLTDHQPDLSLRQGG